MALINCFALGIGLANSQKVAVSTKKVSLIFLAVFFLATAAILSWFTNFRLLWILVSLFLFVSVLITINLARRHNLGLVWLSSLSFLAVVTVAMTLYKAALEERYFFDYRSVPLSEVKERLEEFRAKAKKDDVLIEKMLKGKKLSQEE